MRLSIALLLLAFLSPAAHASAVVIWPVDPVIGADERATALWLENKGNQPVTLQVRTFGWSQPGGADALDEQQAIVASPPIATVAPGARQLVRIIRRTADGAPESAYRLLIDELPVPRDTAGGGAVQARLDVQMRYSIPLFTHGAATTPPRLEARFATDQAGRTVTIRNAGTAHARLTDLRLIANGHETMLKAGLAGYVLGGSSLTVPLGAAAGTVKVAVDGVDQILVPSA